MLLRFLVWGPGSKELWVRYLVGPVFCDSDFVISSIGEVPIKGVGSSRGVEKIEVLFDREGHYSFANFFVIRWERVLAKLSEELFIGRVS